MIVLNENEWAKEQLEARELGKKPSETLRRIARYYLDEGYSTKDTRLKLDAFLIQCDPLSSLPKWSDTLDFAVNRANKYSAIEIESIHITDNEMKKIDSLEGKMTRRLAFTLLCLAKYWKYVIPDGDYWVNNSDNEIMSMANISTSIKRQCALYGTLRELGMIQFSKKVDNTSVKVLFIEDGETVLHIKDFRNLGYQYLMYHGEPYFECTNCGITTKIANPANRRRQKYCADCATKIRIQQNIDSVMKYRKSDTSKNVGN